MLSEILMLSPVMPYAFLIAGLVLLYFGAKWLVEAGAKLAIRLGVTPLLVGLTIVAFGTSTPELVVSVQSAMAGVGNISIGNVLGSNICNIALILGLSAIIVPLTAPKLLFRRDIPVCVVASLLAWLFLTNGNTMFFWEGIVLLVLFVGYAGYIIISTKRGAGVDAPPDDIISTVNEKTDSVVKSIVFIIIGLAALVAGADILVKGAIVLAASLGVSEALIGLTIVAVGTSLPELATSIVAALKKQNDIAIGNVVGSNIFNILLILGTVGVMGPVEAKGILLRDMLLMVALSVALFVPILTRRVMTRWFGVVLTAVYVAYIFVLCRGVVS